MSTKAHGDERVQGSGGRRGVAGTVGSTWPVYADPKSDGRSDPSFFIKHFVGKRMISIDRLLRFRMRAVALRGKKQSHSRTLQMDADTAGINWPASSYVILHLQATELKYDISYNAGFPVFISSLERGLVAFGINRVV